MKKFQRLCALFLTLCVTVSTLPTFAMAEGAQAAVQAQSQTASDLSKGDAVAGTDYVVTSRKNYSIAPDVRESVIITNNVEGDSQTVANVMEVNVSNGYAKLAAGYGTRNPAKDGWKLVTTTDQVHLYEKTYGENVVGAINAALFNINTGEPNGYLVMEGVTYKDDSSRAFVATFDDGSVGLYKEGTTLKQAIASQSEKQGKDVQLVDAISGWVVLVDGETVADSGSNPGYYSRSAIGYKGDGTIVILQADGTMAPRSVGYTLEEMGCMMKALGCVYALELDEGGSSTYVSQREGEDDVTMRNNPAGGSERVISTTILVVSNAPSDGSFDHAVITPNSEYYTPNSTVALEATGMDYSGAQADSIPASAVWEFAAGSEKMGTLEAGEISGNTASSTFVSNGTLGDAVINLVNGGKVVGSVTVHIQNPDSLAFTSDEINLNYSQESDLGLVAKYQGEAVNLKDGDVQWTITDETAGTFEGNTFVVTSDKKVSVSAQITAVCGELTDAITVNVGKQPTMILDGGDEDGWNYSNIGTTVESFDGMAEDEVVTYHYAGRGGIVKGSVVSDTDEEYADIVRFGHNAIRLDYDWTGLTGTDGACLGLGSAMDIPGTPTAIGVWVYIPEGVPVPWLRAQIATSSDGESWTNAYINFNEQNTNEGLKTGWQYLEADLTQYSGTKIRVNSGMLFRAMAGASEGFGWYTVDDVALDKSQLKGYIILDNISIVYGANNQDVTNPVVTAIQLINSDGTRSDLENGAVLTGSTINFFAAYNDSEDTDEFATGIESAYFYLDGIYYGEGTRDNLGSTLAGITMADGEHSVTFYLKDGYGNVTRETRYFTVDAGSSMTNVSLEVPANPVVGENWKLNLNTNNLADLAGLETTINLSRGYAVSGVEFPDGIAGTYTYNQEKGKLDIQITGVAEATSGSLLATVLVEVPTSTTEGVALSVQVAKGCYTTVSTEEYWKGFSTPAASYHVSASYRVTAGDLVVGLSDQLTITDLEGNPVKGIDVYYGTDEKLGTTDKNGHVSADALTAEAGSYRVYAMDGEGNRSYPVTVTSYTATGDTSGKPYYVIYNVAADPTTQQNISWMSNPLHARTTARVRLSTSQDMSSPKVVMGSSDVISYSSSGVANRVNSALLTGLTPGTTYYAQVGDGTNWSDILTFTTAQAEDEQTDFFILADIQEEEALTGFQNIVKNLAGTEFDFGLQTGDAVDNVRYYNQWEDALDLFTLEGVSQYDMIHVVGNHEADDDGRGARAAKHVFNLEADWYSVEYGDVYVAVLNHTMDKEKLEQFKAWLVEDAAQSDCAWKVVTTHVPVYYTNPTGGGQEYLQILPEAIEAAGIDFFFAGNDHSYARTAPVTGGSVDEDNGVVYYICGSTGGKSYSVVKNPDFHFEKATVDFDSVYMTVSADEKTITVTTYNVDADGNATVLDTYSKEKRQCADDEHTYSYDRETDTLSCSVCGYTCTATGERYSGFAREQKSQRLMYFVAGQYSTGYLRVENRDYHFNDEGLGYEGAYTLCGEICTFKDGMFSSSENSQVKTAGRCGDTANFVLYQDGTLYVGDTGETKSSVIADIPWQSYRGSITKVVIGADITALSDYAFYDCDALIEVEFEAGGKLKTIGGAVFFSCGWLTEVTVPEGVTAIYGNTFAKCGKLTSVSLPDSVTYLSSKTFTGSANVVLTVGADSYAKEFAVANNIPYVERKLENLGEGTCGDKLTWKLTNEGVLAISGTGAMDLKGEAAPWASLQAEIKRVDIQSGVTGIAAEAFKGCANLASVSIPDTVTFIGADAFKDTRCFQKAVSSGTVYLSGWLVYVDPQLEGSLAVKDGTVGIAELAAVGCDQLTDVTIPASVKYINDRAFSGCAGLTAITFQGGAPVIGENAFEGVTADVDCPFENESWSSSTMQNYGGTLNWLIPRFVDLPENAWYTPYANEAADLCLMSGMGEHRFQPMSTTNRAMFVQILYAMEGKPAVGTGHPFTDVEAGKWYADAVQWAYENTVTGGTSDTTFSPNINVTREQIAVFLYAYYGRPEVTGDLSGFVDGDKVSTWAVDAVIWATQNGIITGALNEDGSLSLNPRKEATRAETATMMVGFYHMVNG